MRHESGWEVLSDAVLGQFSFQKLAMYDDYGRHATKIAEHEHCRRIAGDDSTPPPFAVAIPSSARFDAEVHPSKLHTILPCDSSQLEAILAINSGASLVLDGPPGTGKSQTIANVIAECLADGKTVLFVSEKAVVLEVVKETALRAHDAFNVRLRWLAFDQLHGHHPSAVNKSYEAHLSSKVESVECSNKLHFLLLSRSVKISR